MSRSGTRCDLPQIGLITQAAIPVQNITRTVGLIAAIDDADFKKINRENIETERATFREVLKKLDEPPIADTPAGKIYKDHLQAFKEAVKENIVMNNKVLDAALRGNQAESLRILKSAVPTLVKANEVSAAPGEIAIRRGGRPRPSGHRKRPGAGTKRDDNDAGLCDYRRGALRLPDHQKHHQAGGCSGTGGKQARRGHLLLSGMALGRSIEDPERISWVCCG
jgi:hypothetical protein